MNKKNKRCELQITCFAICMLAGLLFSSCNSIKDTFGQHTFRQYTDTIATLNRITKIRSISNTLFDTGTFTGKENSILKYRLLKPIPGNSPSKKYPLVIVFHGSGAIGNDNTSQLGVLSKLFAMPDIRSKYSCYVLAPQFSSRSSNYVPDSTRHVLTSKPQACLLAALDLIDSLKSIFPIDENRIYAVGFSMGGSSVINALSVRPELFAAGISISGIPQFDKIQNLKQIPIWLIHGNTDTENPIASDELFYKELQSSYRIRFWIFDHTEHLNIFSPLILGEQLPQWLFAQTKN
jgi:predicted peptidase